MAEFDIPKAGEVCWRELRTKDLPKAMEFYSKLFGWTLEQTKVTPMDYKEIIVDGVAAGGMMELALQNQEQDKLSEERFNENENPPSHWANYIAVDNADETAEKIKANGGTVQVPPFDAPGVGRMAMVADPSGADFAIIQFVAPA